MEFIVLQMQTILYHNSSGRDAFTGNLKQKEVHRAITLHPVKQHQHMYRVHNYMKVSKRFLESLATEILTLILGKYLHK
jgi:chondroitin sulfate synthase